MAKKNRITKESVARYLQENNGYPEKGYFEVREDLQKFYKHLTDEQLAEWIAVEGLEYKPSDNESINRMRMAMAILYYHFPKEPAKKKQSKYASYSLEDLIQLALDKEVPVEPTEDERILRMRTIMALRAAGHLD